MRGIRWRTSASPSISAALLNALIYGQASNISAALGRTEMPPALTVRRRGDYIRHHYAGALGQLARIAGVSTRTLFSGFRDFRQPADGYLKAIRLEKAHEEYKAATSIAAPASPTSRSIPASLISAASPSNIARALANCRRRQRG